jgi:uncharacterized membrane protein YgdD (TMEM256/DUF423 family)
MTTPITQAKTLILLGALSGFLTVALGAFGAHGLEASLPAKHMEWWNKAVHYQGLHSLALLATGLLGLHRYVPGIRLAGWAFALGILLFSGSLYALALTGERWLGMVTPFGGMAFLTGWVGLMLAARRLPGPA